MARGIIITGAGSGVGRATARRFLEAGWNVALAGRRENALVEAAQGHPVARVVPTDVTDPEAVRALFDACADAWGRVDALFNNAGTNVAPAPLDEISVEDWRRVLGANLDGAVLCAREAFRVMRAQTPQGGRIVNNGSISAHAPRPGSVPYTVTKHAMTGLTRTLALDGRPFDIACGQIDIGNAETDMIRKAASGMPQADGSVRPEPLMEVRHVADAVLQMCELPPEANVLFMTVMATKMPLVGRG